MKLIYPVLGLFAGQAYGSMLMPSVEDEPTGDDTATGEGDGPDGKRISMVYRNMMADIIKVEYPALQDVNNLYRHVNRVLRNYGCNCFKSVTGGLHVLVAGGQPIDAVDKVCNTYARIYKCMQIDSGSAILNDYNDFPLPWWQINAEQGGSETTPWLTTGQDGPSVNLNTARPNRKVKNCGQYVHFEHHVDNNNVVHCGPAGDAGYASKDDNDCAKVACSVGFNFVYDLISAEPTRWINPLDFYRANRDDATMYEAVCEQHGNPIDECCGAYPDRSPVLPGSQQCCYDMYINDIGSPC